MTSASSKAKNAGCAMRTEMKLQTVDSWYAQCTLQGFLILHQSFPGEPHVITK